MEYRAVTLFHGYDLAIVAGPVDRHSVYRIKLGCPPRMAFAMSAHHSLIDS